MNKKQRAKIKEIQGELDTSHALLVAKRETASKEARFDIFVSLVAIQAKKQLLAELEAKL
jgi:hypothetical protein